MNKSSLIGAALLCAASTTAEATVTAVISCNPCSSLTDLQTAATRWRTTQYVPNGSIVLVTSLNAPISGFFRVYMNPRSAPVAIAVTASNADAATLDNQTFARAAKFAPVKAPPTLPYTEPDEIIVAYLEQSAFTIVSAAQISVWHGLTNFSNAVYYNVRDNQSGQVEKLYIGDTVTVNYPGGYSEKWQFLGPEGGTLQWKRVPNTLMLNGKPVIPPTTSAAPAPGAGAINATNYWNQPGLILSTADLHSCYGVSEISLQLPPDTYMSSGYYTFPC